MKILTKIFSLWLIALTLLGSCKQSVLKEQIRTHTGLVCTNWLHEPSPDCNLEISIKRLCYSLPRKTDKQIVIPNIDNYVAQSLQTYTLSVLARVAGLI